ncbi:MAG TPA: S8 family serine peptidase [Solirubrobacterales bacterium]|nr:S8 family serine peptidase [Solirubrobacterales bacterium]
MNALRAPRGLAPCPVLLGLLGACLLLAARADATPPPGDGNLSPRLVQLTNPAVRSLGPAQEARRLSVTRSGPASLQRLGNRVVVSIRFDQGAAVAADDLAAAGGKVLDASTRYQTVTVAAKPEDLPALAAVDGVADVSEVLTPITRGADCGGLVRSEGDTQLNGAGARTSWGVDGSGVTVGILSDSFDRAAAAVTHAPQDVVSGDLPGPGSPCGSSQPVGVLDDTESAGEDEGRAMAQIVHDLAPGAAIDFASAFGTQISFAENIRALANSGAKVIADDVGYFEEPFFQDGPVAVAINEVTAAGISYFTAAGNDNVVSGGNDVNSFEAPFASAGSCPLGVPLAEGSACADFNPGGGTDNAYDLTVAAGQTVTLDLQWAEPWGGVATDLDAYLLSGSGTVLAKSNARNVTQTQRPYEILSWENEAKSPVNVALAIPRFSGSASPRLKFVQLGNGGQGVVPTPTQYATSSPGATIGPTIIGHSGARSAISTGAVFFADSSAPEQYSSRGPAIHFFGPVIGTAPAPPIGEDVISKPDLVATDCGVTTFFATFVKSEGRWRFCGTSAAAPHAAAVAALMLQANPGAGAAQIRAALSATASPVGTSGPTEVGAGLVNAFAAVNAVALPPTIAFTAAPQALSRERRPTIQFTANRPVAFGCSLDGALPQPCASPYTVPAPLADGKHGFAVTGTDVGGRVGVSPTVSFTIDTRAPRTKIAKHPPKLVRTRNRRARVVFRFRSSESPAAFICKVDHDLLRPCGRRLALRLLPGRHRVRVRAKDPAGNVDSTPAVFAFEVKRVG